MGGALNAARAAMLRHYVRREEDLRELVLAKELLVVFLVRSALAAPAPEVLSAALRRVALDYLPVYVQVEVVVVPAWPTLAAEALEATLRLGGAEGLSALLAAERGEGAGGAAVR